MLLQQLTTTTKDNFQEGKANQNFILTNANNLDKKYTEKVHWNCTFHAYEQQIWGQRSPGSFNLLFVNPVPIESKKIHHYFSAYCIIESLLQVHSTN